MFFEPARCAWSLYCYSPSPEMILPEIKDIQDLLNPLSICETTDAMCAPHCLTASCFTFYFLVKSNMCTPLSESKTFYFLSTCETIILNVCEWLVFRKLVSWEAFEHGLFLWKPWKSARGGCTPHRCPPLKLESKARRFRGQFFSFWML